MKDASKKAKMGRRGNKPPPARTKKYPSRLEADNVESDSYTSFGDDHDHVVENKGTEARMPSREDQRLP